MQFCRNPSCDPETFCSLMLMKPANHVVQPITVACIAVMGSSFGTRRCTATPTCRLGGGREERPALHRIYLQSTYFACLATQHVFSDRGQICCHWHGGTDLHRISHLAIRWFFTQIHVEVYRKALKHPWTCCTGSCDRFTEQ